MFSGLKVRANISRHEVGRGGETEPPTWVQLPQGGNGNTHTHSPRIINLIIIITIDLKGSLVPILLPSGVVLLHSRSHLPLPGTWTSLSVSLSAYSTPVWPPGCLREEWTPFQQAAFIDTQLPPKLLSALLPGAGDMLSGPSPSTPSLQQPPAYLASTDGPCLF